ILQELIAFIGIGQYLQAGHMPNQEQDQYREHQADTVKTPARYLQRFMIRLGNWPRAARFKSRGATHCPPAAGACTRVCSSRIREPEIITISSGVGATIFNSETAAFSTRP